MAFALAWLTCYRPISDPLPFAASTDTVMAISFRGNPEHIEKFLAALPSGALEIYSAHIRDITHRTITTLVASPVAGSLKWDIDLGSQFRKSKIRWIKRNSEGFGFLTDGVDERGWSQGYLPFEFTIEDGIVTMTAGRRAVGPSQHLGSGVWPVPLRLRGLVPDILHLYYYRPEGAEPRFSTKSLGGGLLSVLPVEVGTRTISATSTDFVLHGLTENATATRPVYIEELKGYLGQVEPAGVKKILPDGTNYVENRDGSDFVVESTKMLKVGKLTTLTGVENRKQMVFFEEPTGEYWVSPSLDMIQVGLSQGIKPSILPETCLPRDGREGFLLTHKDLSTDVGGNSWILGWLRGFKLASLVVEDAETGLFTVCGKL